MATPRSLYQDALLEARDRGYLITGAALEQVEEALRLALQAILRQLATAPAGSLTADRAAGISRSIRAALDELARRVVDATVQGRDLVLDDLTEIHRAANVAILETLAVGTADRALVTAIAGGFDQLPLRALQALAARQAAGGGAASVQTVMRYRAEAAASVLDDILAAAVVQGESPRNVARAVEAILAQGLSPEARAVWNGLTIAEAVDPDVLRELSQLGYDARRIARSEVLNALREGDAQGMILSPVVSGARWQVSGRHHVVDECDVLAETDFHGLGPGVYPAELWPTAPHPHCGCYAGTPAMRRPSEWFEPKGRPVARTLDPERMPVRREWREAWTDARLERVRRTVRAALPDDPRAPAPSMPVPR